MTSVLGGIGTIVASLLARLRGSNEPELSIQRVKDLEAFELRLEAYIKDFGHDTGENHNERIEQYRQALEYLLGTGDG